MTQLLKQRSTQKAIFINKKSTNPHLLTLGDILPKIFIEIMKQAIKLILKEETTFDLYFIDGIVKRYDILSLADKFPQLNALRNRDLFLQGKLLGWGGVIWNDELDISSDTVFDEGIDVSYEYDDIENVVIGYKIKQRRLELNLSQSQLAELVGIDQSDLSKIEKGNANPSIKTLVRIANGLNNKVSIDIL